MAIMSCYNGVVCNPCVASLRVRVFVIHRETCKAHKTAWHDDFCKHTLGQTPLKEGLVSRDQANSVCEIGLHISE